MRKYETIAVFSTSLGENEITAEIAKVQALLETNGAKDVNVQRWGRKEISYTVKKQKFGNYVVFEYTSDQSDTVEKTSRILVITDSILKFQTHILRDRHRKVRPNSRPAAQSEDAGDEAVLAEADY